jgi:serine/threonine protein kinase
MIDRAVKYIQKQEIDNAKEIQRFQSEVEILEKMDHFNIVKLYEVYEDDKNFYLIMDLIKGGELFDVIVKR